MKKKVIYLNSKTGKEVHYGDNISFEESGKFENGMSFHSKTTMPIINETISDLIRKGIIIQKEIDENKEKDNCVTIPKEEFDIIINVLTTLTETLLTFKNNDGK